MIGKMTAFFAPRSCAFKLGVQLAADAYNMGLESKS